MLYGKPREEFRLLNMIHPIELYSRGIWCITNDGDLFLGSLNNFKKFLCSQVNNSIGDTNDSLLALSSLLYMYYIYIYPFYLSRRLRQIPVLRIETCTSFLYEAPRGFRFISDKETHIRTTSQEFDSSDLIGYLKGRSEMTSVLDVVRPCVAYRRRAVLQD